MSVTAPASRPVDSVTEQADDAALVRAAQAGDREAFGWLVTRHQRAIYHLCYRYAGDHDAATDLAQDVFLRAYRSLGTFKQESAFATWLYRIAVNLCLNRVSARRLSTEPLDEQSPPPAPDANVAEELVREERSARVREAVNRLPEKQRATLILQVYHELPQAEISRILGTSVGAVKANFFHAVRNLRRLLGDSV